MTVTDFLTERFDLPDSGQWAELVEGELVILQPPDLDHGTTVLNLSKAFAEHAQRTEQGYACFDLGLQIAADPDTVRFPAVSLFTKGDRFAELDNQVTTSVPDFVIELASTADRRKQMGDRVAAYRTWGVRQVWVVDPAERLLYVTAEQRRSQPFKEHETAWGSPVLDGFSIKVSDLFVEPDWWK